MIKNPCVRTTFPNCGRRPLTEVKPTPSNVLARQQEQRNRLNTKATRKEKLALADMILAWRKLGLNEQKTMCNLDHRRKTRIVEAMWLMKAK